MKAISRRAVQFGAAAALTLSAMAATFTTASPAQASQPELCNFDTAARIPLFRQSGSNPAYPDLRLLACMRLDGGGQQTASLDISGTPLSFVKVNWRVEAHTCNPDTGISARGYTVDQFSNGASAYIADTFNADNTKTYKSNGRIASIYVVDTHGSVFTGGGIGGTSPCA
jgi:hypothetical protein